MPKHIVVLKSIDRKGKSEWLVCMIEDGKLHVTNTCSKESHAMDFAQCHAVVEEMEYQAKLRR